MTNKKNLIDSINKTMDKIRDMYEKKIHDLEQELQIRTEQNADLYSKICNAIVQITEANETIKKAAESCPDKNTILCSLPPKPSAGMETYTTLKNYLEKWEGR